MQGLPLPVLRYCRDHLSQDTHWLTALDGCSLAYVPFPKGRIFKATPAHTRSDIQDGLVYDQAHPASHETRRV